MNNITSLLKKYSVFLVGLFIAAMGVGLSTKASLGTSPVASLPYTVSLISKALSFGEWLIVLSIIQIIIQIILLKKNSNPLDLGVQVVVSFVYGYLTNFACSLIDGLKVANYFEQFICMLAGCVVLGFGIWLQLKANVAMLSGEAMNRAISVVSGIKYENIKIFFDIFYIVVSAILGFIFFGELKGVREGSIIAAVTIGNIIKFYNHLWNKRKQAK